MLRESREGYFFMNTKPTAEKLYQPYDCALFLARNRFVRSGTWLAGADDRTGALTGEEIDRYAELGAGCVGTIISGISYINRDGKSFPRQCGIDSDSRIPEYSCLSQIVHEKGSRFILQIAHGGSNKVPDIARGSRTLSPSGVRYPGTGLMSLPMTGFEIKQLRDDFASAAVRAKEAGCDGVEIHGGHGFLLAQFLSPIHNRRDDRYGRTLENRERIFIEVYERVREAVGINFPIFFKLSISEEIEGGYTAEEGIHLAKELLRRGVDGIEVSSGAPYSDVLKRPSMPGVKAGLSEAPFRRYAEAIKPFALPNQAIILCGGIRSLNTAADLIEGGVCDMVSMSRPFNCEPDLVRRWAEEDYRPAACISCNNCFKTAEEGLIYCSIRRNKNKKD